MRRFDLVMCAVVSLWLVSTASAQTGRVTGTVKDPDGKAIKGAVIRAENQAVAARMTSTSDDKGRFSMIGLRTGQWTIEVEAPGFLPARGPATISTGNSAILALTLDRDPGPMPGALAKSIADDIQSAEVLRKAGRFDDAIAAYQTIQAKNTRLTSVNLMLGTLYREKAQQEKDDVARHALLERAATAYSAMLKADESSGRARIELALTQVALGNTDTATQLFQDVIAANPGTSVADEAAARLQELGK